jgi:nucleoside-diphosphate-sugar epimerase
MKILVIGGSGFIGPYVVRQLVDEGHGVTVLHRGNSKPSLPKGVQVIHGDRNQLPERRREFEKSKFDAVVDVILSSEKQARALLETFTGITGRIVALSSQDTYRAYAVILGMDDGPVEPLPLTEESALRTKPPYPPEHAMQMQAIFTWLDAEYDKVPVEKTLNRSTNPPVTILRLPMVYGPGDPLHRFHPILKRIDDGRKTLLLDGNTADMHSPRGYVEDVAHAIVMATTSSNAAGRTYNVVEEETFTELEWTKLVADAVGWKGEIRVLPTDRTPAHLRLPINNRQDWLVSSARIREELGYREMAPREEALRRTIEWERANRPSIPLAVFDYAAEDAALATLTKAS